MLAGLGLYCIVPWVGGDNPVVSHDGPSVQSPILDSNDDASAGEPGGAHEGLSSQTIAEPKHLSAASTDESAVAGDSCPSTAEDSDKFVARINACEDLTGAAKDSESSACEGLTEAPRPGDSGDKDSSTEPGSTEPGVGEGWRLGRWKDGIIKSLGQTSSFYLGMGQPANSVDANSPVECLGLEAQGLGTREASSASGMSAPSGAAPVQEDNQGLVTRLTTTICKSVPFVRSWCVHALSTPVTPSMQPSWIPSIFTISLPTFALLSR